MKEFFQEAGVAIFLITVTGALALGWGASFAYRATAKKRRVARALMTTTFLGGAFGFTAGLVNTLKASATAEPDQWRVILTIGTQESMNNLFAAFAFISLVSLFLVVGEARASEA
jgi:hypothetical protein